MPLGQPERTEWPLPAPNLAGAFVCAVNAAAEKRLQVQERCRFIALFGNCQGPPSTLGGSFFVVEWRTRGPGDRGVGPAKPKPK
jgi:hypothetical protein